MSDVPDSGHAAMADPLQVTLEAMLRDKRLQDIERMLDASPDRSGFWSVLTRAVRAVHGPGAVFNAHGMSRTLDHLLPEDRRSSVLAAVVEVLEALRRDMGLPSFVTSGTLLGAVREGNLIPHDDDIDAAYVSRASTSLDWALEWYSITQFLNSQGYRTKRHLPGLLHVEAVMPGSTWRFDLFSGLVTADGGFVEYPLETGVLHADDILPLGQMDLLGVPIPVPARPVRLLEVNYGRGWQTPDPTWRHDWDRSGRQYRDMLPGMSGPGPNASWLRQQLALLDERAEQDLVARVTVDVSGAPGAPSLHDQLASATGASASSAVWRIEGILAGSGGQAQERYVQLRDFCLSHPVLLRALGRNGSGDVLLHATIRSQSQ